MSRKSHDERACKKEDATSLDYYIAYLLITFGYARILPVESFKPHKTLLSVGATAILLSSNFLLLLPEIVALTMSSNLSLFANILGVIGMHSTGIIKWCYCISRNRKILDIVKTLDRCHVLCQRIDNSEEGYRLYETEMEHARQYSSFFTCFWTYITVYGVLHWCLNPLFLESWGDQMNSINRTFMKRRLPYIAWYPWSIDDTNSYICVYLMQIIGGIAAGLGIVCYDVFYITMLMIVCAQFRHINAILTRTDSDKHDRMPEAIFTLERKLKNCIDCHVEIIKFLEMLQTFTSPTMFMQCVQTLFILCLVSFEASAIEFTTSKECILKLWSLIEYFLCSSVQLYLFCFFATRLEHLGSQVAHSVYSCGWELIATERKGWQLDLERQLKPRNVDKLVQTIMIRAQRPIILTGGPFYVLSLETFRVIIGMAMSNCVMLRTISERDE